MVPAYLSSDSLLQTTAAAKTNQLTAICPSENVHIQASRCQLLVSASNRTSMSSTHLDFFLRYWTGLELVVFSLWDWIDLETEERYSIKKIIPSARLMHCILALIPQNKTRTYRWCCLTTAALTLHQGPQEHHGFQVPLGWGLTSLSFPKALAMSLPYHLLNNFTYIFSLSLSAFRLLNQAFRVLALVCLLYEKW